MIVKYNSNYTSEELLTRIFNLENKTDDQLSIIAGDDDNEATNLKQMKDLISIARLENNNIYELSSLIPDTPDITDGFQLFDAVITPKNSNSIIKIDLQIYHAMRHYKINNGWKFRFTNTEQRFIIWDVKNKTIIDSFYIKLENEETFTKLLNTSTYIESKDNEEIHLRVMVGSDTNGIYINTASKGHRSNRFTSSITITEIGETSYE